MNKNNQKLLLGYSKQKLELIRDKKTGNKKMTTLTKENANTGIKLKNKSSPEWGTWVLTLDEVNGNHSIKTSHGERCLFEDEFKFWDILD